MLNVPKCSSCGYYHPIDPKNPCKKEEGINEESLGKFIRQLSNIVTSQITIKKVKNQEKFFNHIILSMTKKMEDYIE